jgi:TetR/AcrR family transcriptional regulator, regulator of cefoperazone and chloramphenicol sensitivity
MDLVEMGTKRRLLTTAERLFAERGYTHTTVAEITRQAHCNVSAVNYYFHGKEELYRAVFRHVVADLRKPGRASDRLDCPEELSLEELVEVMVRDFVAPFLGEDSGQRLMKLALQERDDPHLPRGFFMTEVIEPLRRTTIKGFKGTLSTLDDVTMALCLDSIVAQLLYLIHAWSFYEGVDKVEMPLLDVERALTHVVAFSTAGLRHFLGRSP